jgi:hypothetical protein
MEVNDSQLEVSESKVEKLENAETSSKVDWHQNKRFPRIFPGVILSAVTVLNTTFNSEPESWSEGTWYRLSWTFFATNVVQALNFYILWRCVKDKKSRMSES